MIDTQGQWVTTFEIPLPDSLGAPLPSYTFAWPKSLSNRAAYSWLFLSSYDRLIDFEGKQADYWIEDSGYFFRDGLVPIVRDGKIGYINENLDIVIPCQFQHPGPNDADPDDPWQFRVYFSDGIAPAMMDDR